MRIGILTFHNVINYGAFLQAFSLLNKLQEQFPNDEVEIIDYTAPKARKRKLYMVLWNVKHHGIKGGLSELKRISVFKSAQKHLSLSPRSFCTGNLKKLYSYIDKRYDLLIIGSDAVFNWNQTKFPTAFIPDYRFSIPVYTYAASVHGLRFYSASNEILQNCGNVFERMECIGVRDNCSEKFVKLCYEGARTLHCCDPTLFRDKEVIYQIGISAKAKIQKKYGFSLDSKYIVVMAPDSNMVKEVSKRYGDEYKIISVFVKSSFADYYVADLNPFEWTVILKQADLVVTSYFHGTLLSLVQGTPVIVLDYSGYCDNQYEGKLRDLLFTRFEMPELCYDKNEADNFVGDDSFYKKIDELLAGGYKKRIDNAVEKERKALDAFITLLKSTAERLR